MIIDVEQLSGDYRVRVQNSEGEVRTYCVPLDYFIELEYELGLRYSDQELGAAKLAIAQAELDTEDIALSRLRFGCVEE